jgi:hypothetical protein
MLSMMTPATDFDEYISHVGHERSVVEVGKRNMLLVLRRIFILCVSSCLGWDPQHKEIYEAKGAKLAKSDEEVYIMDGKRMRGIYRDSSYGVPMGCVEVFKKTAKTIQRVRTLEDSEKAVRGKAQLDETWRAAISASELNFKKAKTADDADEKVKLSTKKAKDCGNSDSSCDWQDIVKPTFVAGSESDSSNSSDAEKKKKEKTKKKKKTTSCSGKKRSSGKSTGSSVARLSASVVPTIASNVETPKKESKVYPSVQMRQIVQLEQLAGEIEVVLSSAGTEEGLKSLQVGRFTSFISKIDSKLDKPDKLRQVTAVNFLKEGQCEHNLKEKGDTVVGRLASQKEQLNALSNLVTSLACTDETELESTPAYLSRACAEVSSLKIALPPNIMSEIVKRQCFSYITDNNIPSAIATLDANLALPSGIACLGKCAEVQSVVQCEIALGAIGVLLDRPWSADVADLESMVGGLPAIAKSTMVTAACKSISALIDPAKHTEQGVMDAIAALGDAATVGDVLQKKMGSTRARALVARARQFVMQRSLDDSLQKEIISLHTSTLALKAIAVDSHNEDALVSMRFSAKELSKIKLRFLGIISKCSDGLKTKQSHEIKSVEDFIDARTQVMVKVMEYAFWANMKAPIQFITDAISGRKLSEDDHTKALDALKSRIFTLCLAKPQDIGCIVLMDADGFVTLAKRVELYTELKNGITEVVRTWEFVDDHTSEFDIFNEQTMKMWSTLKEMALVSVDEAQQESPEKNSVDDARSWFTPMVVSFTKKAAEWLNVKASEEQWFSSGLRVAVAKEKSMQWPTSLEKTIEKYEELDSCIAHAVALLKDARIEGSALPAASMGATVGYEGMLALVSFARVAEVRLDCVSKLKKQKKGSVDVRHVTKRTSVLVKYKEVLTNALQEVRPSVANVLGLELTESLVRYEEVYREALSIWKHHVNNAHTCANDANIKCDKFYDEEDLNLVELSNVSKGPKAKEFMTAWQQLLQIDGLMDSVSQPMSAPDELEAQKKIELELNMEGIQEQHQMCKNKVAEFVAIRALARPLKPGETRESAMRTASGTIGTLKGVLCPKLGLALGPDVHMAEME